MFRLLLLTKSDKFPHCQPNLRVKTSKCNTHKIAQQSELKQWGTYNVESEAMKCSPQIGSKGQFPSKICHVVICLCLWAPYDEVSSLSQPFCSYWLMETRFKCIGLISRIITYCPISIFLYDAGSLCTTGLLLQLYTGWARNTYRAR